jgi:DegV family protein with EDD domain
VIDAITRTRQRIKLYAVLDTLDYLRRSGRANAVVALLGEVLQIKPLVELSGGEVKLMARQRTFGKALDQLAETVKRLGPLERLAILHAHNPEAAHALAQRLAPHCAQPPLVTEIAAVIGTHVGPGAVGVAVVTQT